MYKVVITKKAQKNLDKLPLQVLKAFRVKFKVPAEDPFAMPNVKKLTNPAFISPDIEAAYRLRVGDYRAIFTIDEAVITITIVRIDHRSQVYKK